MTPLPVNMLNVIGGGGKSVAFVLIVFAAIAIIATKLPASNQTGA